MIKTARFEPKHVTKFRFIGQQRFQPRRIRSSSAQKKLGNFVRFVALSHLFFTKTHEIESRFGKSEGGIFGLLKKLAEKWLTIRIYVNFIHMEMEGEEGGDFSERLNSALKKLKDSAPLRQKFEVLVRALTVASGSATSQFLETTFDLIRHLAQELGFDIAERSHFRGNPIPEALNNSGFSTIIVDE